MPMTPILQIEFHEKKSRNLTMPYIETQYYVTDIMAFLTWCNEGERLKEWAYDSIISQITKMRTWKRPTPNFINYLKGKLIYIYPKQNVVAVVKCALHYVCQHSFDILPQRIRAHIYSEDNFEIGELFTLKGQRLTVMSLDIIDGFMLHSEQSQVYGDSFVSWIQHRRNKEKGDDGK